MLMCLVLCVLSTYGLATPPNEADYTYFTQKAQTSQQALAMRMQQEWQALKAILVHTSTPTQAEMLAAAMRPELLHAKSDASIDFLHKDLRATHQATLGHEKNITQLKLDKAVAQKKHAQELQLRFFERIFATLPLADLQNAYVRDATTCVLPVVRAQPLYAPIRGTVKYIGPWAGQEMVLMIEARPRLYLIFKRVHHVIVRPGDVVTVAQPLTGDQFSGQAIELSIWNGRQGVEVKQWQDIQWS